MADRILELEDKATKTNDPEKLRKIAAELLKFGATDIADLVRGKAHEEERKMAAKAAR